MKLKNIFQTVFAMLVLFATGSYLNLSAQDGVILAFSGGMFTSSMQTYRSLLEQRMQLVAWNISFWQAFMGFVGGKKSMFDGITPHGMKKQPTATGKPIEVLQDFAHMGGIDMDIPIFYPLTGKGVSGNVTLTGKGERAKLAVMQVAINQQRHAYLQQDNKMSKQILQSPGMVKQLFRRSNEYLGDWFNRWLAYQPYLTFLQGYSENLSKTAINGGLAKGKASHMNIYVAGSGKVAFSTTKATYELAVAAALNGLTNTSSDWFSTKFIEANVYNASHSHRIAPLKVGGMNLYPYVISDAAAKQLQEESKWNDRMKYAAERSLENNPLFQGKIAGIYGGALIIIDETVPSGYTSADGEYSNARATTSDANGVCYGTEDTAGDHDFMAQPVDPGAKKASILFGRSALSCGVASDLSFNEETTDFGQRIEIGADMIIGMQRSDILDKDGYFSTAGDKRYENVSSLEGFSYSPAEASYT